MGRFIYSPATKVEIEDRALAHLQHVMGAKLRRGECFYFTWKEDASVGGGRRSVWMHPGVFVEFRFHKSRVPALNRDWLEALAYAANTPHGLYVVPEPAAGSRKAPPTGPTAVFHLDDET